MAKKRTVEEEWVLTLTEGENIPHRLRQLMAVLPSSPRCKMCNSPFRGVGGLLMSMTGRKQSKYNPRYCARCDVFEHPGGAEVELSMLFADVRGSTALAASQSLADYSRLINRFYVTATDVLVEFDAMVDRLVGDQVVGLFIPGLAGKDHALKAIQAAQRLLILTGHGHPDGPWIPVGAGVHTGPAYVGIVGGSQNRPTDFTALGDQVNITARLASTAGTGEILISQTTQTASGYATDQMDYRRLELKGISEPVGVWAMHV